MAAIFGQFPANFRFSGALDRGDTCSTSATWSYGQQILEEKGWINEWISQLMTRLFVEQPQLHRVC